MNQEGTKRKLAAILSADVKEYSRLMSQDERGTIRTLTAYKEAMSSLIEEYKGRVVDAPGDNLLAEFGSVVDAVNCAVEIQRELAERNAELPYSRRMEFRIGINLGDIVEEEKKIYGDGVNIAARVESLAEGGGVCISGNVHEQVKNRIGLEYEYLGEQAVKNIPEPVHVYRVLSFPGAAAHRVVKAKTATERQWRRVALVIAAVVVIGAGALAIWNFFLRPAPPEVEPASVEKMVYPLPDDPSIAVLPFVNMSEDPKQEFFSDGLTEEIITILSQIPRLFVIARNSTFTYKGKPVKVQQVAEELGVQYVMEGSVRKSGDRMRITAQLVDALKGYHLWAKQYDRDLKDIFALQDEITKEVLAAIEVKITEGEQLVRKPRNLEAYLKHIEGREYGWRFTKQDNLRAIQLIEEAIALDPEYAEAYRCLGWKHLNHAWYGWSDSPEKSIERGIELFKKALSIDDSLPLAHTGLAAAYLQKRDHEKATAEVEQEIALKSNLPLGLTTLSWVLTCLGRADEAVSVAEKAVRLNPFPPPIYLRSLAFAYGMSGQYEKAVGVYNSLVDKNPNNVSAQLGLAFCYVQLERENEARKAAEEVIRIQPKFSLESYAKRLLFRNPADNELLVDSLRKAGLPEHPPLALPDKPSIAVLPFTNISDDPEQEYFADGMTDDLITDLSKISGLFVIARNSAFQYKGKPVDVKKISRELGVRYLLEGSVRRADNQVRINAQLIDSTTGGHLWTERYDGKMDDIFALQDKINQKIVTALAVKLKSGEQELIARKEADNIEAYEAFLRGRQHFRRFTPNDFEKALTYFEKAIELDPNYEKAHAALAWLYWWSSRYSSFGRVKWLPLSSIEHDQRLNKYYTLAMKNPTSSAHALFSQMNWRSNRHEEAIAEAEKAIALDPNDPDGHVAMSVALTMAGRQKEALDFAHRAMRLDPYYPATYLFYLGLTQFALGQIEDAVNSFERALKRNPKLWWINSPLASAYALLGHEQEARGALDKQRLASVSMARWYYPFKDPEVMDRFIEGLRKAGLK